MTKETYNRVFIALPSVLLTIGLFMLGTIIVPKMDKIEENTATQNERLWDRVRDMEKTIDKMKLQIALVSIMPPTQAIKLETTEQWRNLFELLEENQ